MSNMGKTTKWEWNLNAYLSGICLGAFLIVAPGFVAAAANSAQGEQDLRYFMFIGEPNAAAWKYLMENPRDRKSEVASAFKALGGEVLNYWFGEKTKENLPSATLKKLLLFTVFAFFAVLANPSGFELWRLPFHTLDVSLSIQEWHSPNFHHISFHPMLWMLFLFILGVGNSAKKIDYSDLLKVLGFAYLTFISQRNVAPFAIILLPVLSHHLALTWDNLAASRIGQLAQRFQTLSASKDLPLKLTRLINGLLISLIALAALGNLYLLTRPAEVNEHYPVAAVQWINENQPEGTLFNSYNWGGYLIWALRDHPVFVDGRADLYGDEMLNQWKQVVAGGDAAQEILNEWEVDLILLEPDWTVINELSQYGWELLYKDEMSVIYGR